MRRTLLPALAIALLAGVSATTYSAPAKAASSSYDRRPRKIGYKHGYKDGYKGAYKASYRDELNSPSLQWRIR